jgi:Protein of unknown function (DUF1573)
MIIRRMLVAWAAGLILLSSCTTDNRQITSDMIHFPPTGGGEADQAPAITFDSAVCHFGTLAIGEKYPHTFRFTNTGNAPLIITQVNPSCGCTTAKDWPQQPIAPGETGQISVEFNSNGNSGPIDKSISILTNCIPAVEVLRLQGTVVGVESATTVKSPVQMEMETP